MHLYIPSTMHEILYSTLLHLLQYYVIELKKNVFTQKKKKKYFQLKIYHFKLMLC